MNLGSVLQELGRFQEAAAAFRRSVEIAPQFAPAYVALGKVLERLGESDEAAEYYRRAIEIDPRQQAALESLNRMESVADLDGIGTCSKLHHKADGLARAKKLRGTRNVWVAADLGLHTVSWAKNRSRLAVRISHRLAKSDLDVHCPGAVLLGEDYRSKPR